MSKAIQPPSHYITSFPGFQISLLAELRKTGDPKLDIFASMLWMESGTRLVKKHKRNKTLR